MKQLFNEITKQLEKNNVKIGYEISFPKYNILPDEVRLAMKVLQNHGMKINVTLQEKK